MTSGGWIWTTHDAAAYSAAIVQADTISRVAAINRAMSWTYAQAVKMEMDAIVDKWLELTVDLWDLDNKAVRAFAAGSSCSRGRYTGWDDWYTGRSYGQREHVKLNKGPWVKITEILSARAKAAAAGKSYGTLKPLIKQANRNIDDMGRRLEDDLIPNLPDRIERAVIEVLKKNVADTWHDKAAGGADFMFALKQESDPNNYFDEFGNTKADETLFLNYRGENLDNNPRTVFGNGADEWFVRQIHSGGEGIQRMYYRPHQNLIAEWWWFGGQWHRVGNPPVCIRVGQLGQGYSSILGEDGWDEDYYVTALARPRRLAKTFFNEAGAIIVGVSRCMNNPFQFMLGANVGPNQRGIFNAFTLNEDRRFMWAAAAARAAYHMNPPEHNFDPGSGEAGEFDSTFWPKSREMENLKYSDWDAVLLPLLRAWSQGDPQRWVGGETAGEILGELRSGAWRPLYPGGSGALGYQGAPKRMHEGAEVAYGSVNRYVLH